MFLRSTARSRCTLIQHTRNSTLVLTSSSSLVAVSQRQFAKVVKSKITQPFAMPKLEGSPFPTDLSNPNAVPHIPLIFKQKARIVDSESNEIIEDDESEGRRKKRQFVPFDWPQSNDNDLTLTDFTQTLLRPFPWIRTTQPVIRALPFDNKSKRTGLIGIKCGMMQLYDTHGVRFAVTVVRIDSQVTGHRHVLSKDGMVGLQLGAGKRKLKRLKKSELAHFKKAGVYPKSHLKEFPVTPDALLPLGYSLNASHFKPGQYIDVTGITIGKGHAGAMKRWNFSGQPATHGVSLAHRSIGSTGGRQDPGRVFKGKKMSGQLGCEQVTTMNLKIYKIDPVRNLLFIKGAIPGHRDNYVYLRDAIRKPFTSEQRQQMPFPTNIIQLGQTFTEEEMTDKPSEVDPQIFAPS